MSTELTPIFELLDAYIQEFEPAIARNDLPDVVKTILPLIETGRSLNVENAAAVVDRVVALFDPHLAHVKVVTDSARGMAVAIANTLTKLRSHQLATLVGQALQQHLNQVVSQADLPDVVKQLLPTVTHFHLRQADLPQLTSQVIAMLNPDVTSRVTNLTEAIATGKQLVSAVIENLGSQQFVVDVLKSFAQTMVGGMIADADLPDMIKPSWQRWISSSI